MAATGPRPWAPAGAGGFAALEADGGAAAVTVTAKKQVGPYETVQLHSNDGSALNQWLTSHGYAIPEDVKPVIAAYVAGHFDFLAFKLVPGAGVQAMQPVRVTSQGAAPSLPLHMVAVGTGPTTGITIWIVADGRWQPSNFPTFTIDDAELSWDWSTNSSNYETLRLSKEAALGGRGWQIESSLDLAQYTITNALLDNIYGDTTAGAGGYLSASPATAPDAGVTHAPDAGDAADASVVDGASSSSDAEAGVSEAGEEEGGDDAGDVAAANADLAVFFSGISGANVRITRMRSDIARAALSVDMILEAATDQSEALEPAPGGQGDRRAALRRPTTATASRTAKHPAASRLRPQTAGAAPRRRATASARLLRSSSPSSASARCGFGASAGAISRYCQWGGRG